MKRCRSVDDSASGDEAETPERPTVPVPRPSPVRVLLVQVAYGRVAEDVVVADLARDPRSEFCYERASGPALVKTTDTDVVRIAPLRAPNLRGKRRA